MYKINIKCNLSTELLIFILNLSHKSLKAKIFEVLNTFSKEDFVRFGQFVESDYFNTSAMLRALYSVIRKNYSKLAENKLTREFLFEAIYPGREYREGTIVNLLSGLYKLSEDYLSVEMYREQTIDREKYLLKALGSRRLNKFFNKNYDELVKSMDKAEIQNEEYYFNRYDIDIQRISYTPNESAYMKTEIIQDCHDKLIDVMLLKFLNVYIFMLNNKKYGYDHKFNMSFIDNIISYISGNSFEHIPAVLIHFNLMMLLKDDGEKYYFKLKELLREHSNILESAEKWTAYISMANYCETRPDAGNMDERFPREVYDLYRTIIEKRIYKIQGWYPHLHHRLYLNVVLNALNQKEFEWCENFMNVYKSEISEEYREGTYNLCSALFYFSRNEFEKSLKYLNKVQNEDPFYFLQIKALTLQIYYELNLFDTGLTAIDSYKHYLKEKTEIPDRYKCQHRNFVNIVYKLFKIKCGDDQYVMSKFDPANEEYRNPLKKGWILEKIEEIKGA